MRLTPKLSAPASTLLDHMIDSIDTKIEKTKHTRKQTMTANASSLPQTEKMQRLDPDILYQSILTARIRAENFNKTVVKKQKYSIKDYSDRATHKKKNLIINTIEYRRLHEMEYATYTIQYKL